MKLLAAGLLLSSCSGETASELAVASPPRAVPVPGAVLLVSGLPLTAEEVAPLAADIQVLYPEYSPTHARRLALTNEFLPRLAVRAMVLERWEEARAACQANLPDTAATWSGEGDFRTLGLGLWHAARHRKVGEWSEPVDLIGRWARLRLDGRTEDPEPLREQLSLSLLQFPYLDPAEARAEVERAIDRARLEIVDPAWDEAVPETWKHRMRGSKP